MSSGEITDANSQRRDSWSSEFGPVSPRSVGICKNQTPDFHVISTSHPPPTLKPSLIPELCKMQSESFDVLPDAEYQKRVLDTPRTGQSNQKPTFACSWSGCGRVYRKREHLQRHERSRKCFLIIEVISHRLTCDNRCRRCEIRVSNM